jgi:type II secretory ATPase GspE/PulE/Tfp pilus assembly ATPase PilB-like protein
MPKFDDNRVNAKIASLHLKEEEALISNLAPQYGIEYINLHGFTIDPEALRLVPEGEARHAELAIFTRGRDGVSVAVRNPNNPVTKESVQNLTAQGLKPTLYIASPDSLNYAWERYADRNAATAEKRGVLDVDPDAVAEIEKDVTSYLDVATKVQEIIAVNNAERVSHTVEVIFGGALALSASDVHIEPERSAVRLRYRLDGVLWDITHIDKSIYSLLNSRLKLLSGLKLNVHDEAQDGRFSFEIGNRKLEVRSSVIPGAFGESIVMRLLDPDASSFQLENLGLNKRLHAVILEELTRPNGAIVTTGPTGSGKTTALYSFLQKVHKPGIKIITIEDPVEYQLPGIVQTQVTDDYTFESGLRAILRQDPDVIMVGEIRDREVAETAVHAALTGHLVFSTLHTNSAVGAFPRLIDLGVDYRMIGSAFNIIIGQRLIRTLCEHCKLKRDATVEEQKIIARIMDEPVASHSVYEAPGCPKCGGSGFKGRIGIFEAIQVDKAVEEAITTDQRERTILAAAAPQGIPSMQQDGIMKVLSGITSLDELARVIDLHNTRADDLLEETPRSDHTLPPDEAEIS